MYINKIKEEKKSSDLPTYLPKNLPDLGKSGKLKTLENYTKPKMKTTEFISFMVWFVTFTLQ